MSAAGGQSFEIRRLGVGDAAEFRTRGLAALKADPQAFGSSYEAEVGRPLAEFAERLSGSSVFAAYAGGRPVGMTAFKRREGARERHKGFVWGTYVEADMRRSGVAAALMAALLEAAAGELELLTLCVVKENAAAIALYRKFGFRVYGIEPRALKDAGGYADEVLMVRELAG